MGSKRLPLFLVAAFAIAFSFFMPNFASGQLPRPPTLEEIDAAAIDAYFAPYPGGELDFAMPAGAP